MKEYEISYDKDKQKKLVQYLCYRHGLTIEQINRILWEADVAAYLKLGKSITGETYIKNSR